nr:hypothetical protein GCM10020092_076350 [Actinoplanes digitatis]
MPAFELPDRITSLPARTFEFDPSAAAAASAILAGRPAEALHRLLRDQESQVGLLVARRVIAAFLGEPAAPHGPAEDAAALTARILEVREDLAPRLRALAAIEDTEVRDAVLRQRAPLALIGGCWLDTLSQPTTQPAVIVNRLFGQHFVLHGEGNHQRGIHHQRRRALEEAGVYLPAVDAVDFLVQARARELTALHGLFQLSLSRLSASFLPETTGAHVAHHLLGVDDLLLGRASVLGAAELGEVLLEYATTAGPADWRRTLAAADLVVALEREHVELLESTARWYAELPLEGKVCEIIGQARPLRRPPARRGTRRRAQAVGHAGRPGAGPGRLRPDDAQLAAAQGDPRRRQPVHARHQVRRPDVRHLRRAGGRRLQGLGAGRTGGIAARHGSAGKPAR